MSLPEGFEPSEEIKANLAAVYEMVANGGCGCFRSKESHEKIQRDLEEQRAILNAWKDPAQVQLALVFSPEPSPEEEPMPTWKLAWLDDLLRSLNAHDRKQIEIIEAAYPLLEAFFQGKKSTTHGQKQAK